MPVHITARHMFKEKETNVSQRPKDIIYLVLYLPVPKEEEIAEDIWSQGLCKCDFEEQNSSANQSSHVKCQSCLHSLFYLHLDFL